MSRSSTRVARRPELRAPGTMCASGSWRSWGIQAIPRSVLQVRWRWISSDAFACTPTWVFTHRSRSPSGGGDPLTVRPARRPCCGHTRDAATRCVHRPIVWATVGLSIARDINPWANCDTDAERLDIFNDLILTPHLDAAFDSCFITTAPGETVFVSNTSPSLCTVSSCTRPIAQSTSTAPRSRALPFVPPDHGPTHRLGRRPRHS